MLFYRACPKCRTGAVQPDDDQYGPYLRCLNCGFMKDIEQGVMAEVAMLAVAPPGRPRLPTSVTQPVSA